VAIFLGKADRSASLIERMKAKVDSVEGRRLYDRRLGTVEPVFGNHRNHRRDRFTLRGNLKVNTQWLPYSLVHNLGKVHASGAMATWVQQRASNRAHIEFRALGLLFSRW
jgi:hypothetical protein